MKAVKQLDESVRILWALVMAFFFAYSLVSICIGSGCSQAAKKDILNFLNGEKVCAESSVTSSLPEAEAQLAKDIASAISGGVAFDSQAWKDTALGLVSMFGACTIANATVELYKGLLQKPIDAGIQIRAVPGINAKQYLTTAFSVAVR